MISLEPESDTNCCYMKILHPRGYAPQRTTNMHPSEPSCLGSQMLGRYIYEHPNVTVAAAEHACQPPSEPSLHTHISLRRYYSAYIFSVHDKGLRKWQWDHLYWPLDLVVQLSGPTATPIALASGGPNSLDPDLLSCAPHTQPLLKLAIEKLQ